MGRYLADLPLDEGGKGKMIYLIMHMQADDVYPVVAFNSPVVAEDVCEHFNRAARTGIEEYTVSKVIII